MPPVDPAATASSSRIRLRLRLLRLFGTDGHDDGGHDDGGHDDGGHDDGRGGSAVVYARTRDSIITRDHRALAGERARRRAAVASTGFGSPNHEPYRPLGAPVLDVDALIAPVVSPASDTKTTGEAPHHSHHQHHTNTSSLTVPGSASANSTAFATAATAAPMSSTTFALSANPASSSASARRRAHVGRAGLSSAASSLLMQPHGRRKENGGGGPSCPPASTCPSACSGNDCKTAGDISLSKRSPYAQTITANRVSPKLSTGADSPSSPASSSSRARTGDLVGDGLELLQEKMAEARYRLSLVKYGSTLDQALELQLAQKKQQHQHKLDIVATNSPSDAAGVVAHGVSSSPLLNLSLKNTDIGKNSKRRGSGINRSGCSVSSNVGKDSSSGSFALAPLPATNSILSYSSILSSPSNCEKNLRKSSAFSMNIRNASASPQRDTPPCVLAPTSNNENLFSSLNPPALSNCRLQTQVASNPRRYAPENIDLEKMRQVLRSSALKNVDLNDISREQFNAALDNSGASHKAKTVYETAVGSKNHKQTSGSPTKNTNLNAGSIITDGSTAERITDCLNSRSPPGSGSPAIGIFLRGKTNNSSPGQDSNLASSDSRAFANNNALVPPEKPVCVFGSDKLEQCSRNDIKLLTMRDSFEKTKLQLNRMLNLELQRVERRRIPLIIEKSKQLKIKNNGVYSSDLEQMRGAARTKLREKRRGLLRRHPWYYELLRVASCNGLRQRITESERRLIDQVRGLIGDVGDVERGDFVSLLREIPGPEFQREEVQRLVKFLKTSLQVSELAYLEALEESGHMTSSSIITAAATAKAAAAVAAAAAAASNANSNANANTASASSHSVAANVVLAAAAFAANVVAVDASTGLDKEKTGPNSNSIANGDMGGRPTAVAAATTTAYALSPSRV